MQYLNNISDFEYLNTKDNSVQQFCPECGAGMNETDRINENGSTYVWYDCNKINCKGSLFKIL